MDSVNSSGSIQSSSGGGGGGDEESYDSRADSSISAFLYNNSAALPNSHPLPPQHRHNNMFDPLSNYFDPLLQRTTTTTPFPNPSYLDVMWSKPTRSEPNPTDLGGLNQQMNQLQGETNSAAAAAANFVATTHGNTLLSSESGNKNTDQGHNNSTSTNVVRNPKKRSRASRRAPTTVLTTDTTNFRAMVQEFTGIPAPPFSSSPFPTTRFDLFAASTIRSRSPRLDPPLPNYLIRPFPRQLHPFPPSSFLPSTSMVDCLLASSNNPTTTTTNPTSVNPTSFFGFQTISQPPQNYSLGNSSLEIPPSTGDFIHKMGVFGELGLRHGRVNDDVLSPSVGVGALSSGNNNNNNLSNAIASTEWGQRTSGTITNNDCDHGGGALTGTVNYSDVANGKVHYSAASSSDFHGDKGPECSTVATRRSQGMVESWIN